MATAEKTKSPGSTTAKRTAPGGHRRQDHAATERRERIRRVEGARRQPAGGARRPARAVGPGQAGPLERRRHELPRHAPQLDEIIEAAREFSDTVAERMRALHALPDGRSDTVAETTTLPEFPQGEIDTAEVVDLITERLEAAIGTVPRRARRRRRGRPDERRHPARDHREARAVRLDGERRESHAREQVNAREELIEVGDLTFRVRSTRSSGPRRRSRSC